MTTLQLRLIALLSAAFLSALAHAPAAHASDGKWTPGQVLDIDPEWLAGQGLRLPPSALWDGSRGTGLLTGAVSIGGCSGGFVSSTGLIVTNHHCLFSVVQEHSSPARNLIDDGFVAGSTADELPASTLRVQIPRRFTDVTAEVLAAVPTDATPLQRADAIEARQKALVASCEEQPDTSCRVAVFDAGVQYTLIETITLRDVRLVYAPPRSIGEYGGEIDNWMWPRHTGDFAIARAWVGPDGRPADRSDANVPYRPEFFFPISQRGLAVDEFVMVLGYPGITWRALIAEEMQERRERFFVRREDLFGELIRIMQQATADDPAGRIAIAANLKGIQNRHKNAQGQIAGLDRGNIVDKQHAHDDAVAAWAADHPEHAAAVRARGALRELLADRLQTWERDFLLTLMPLGIESVAGGIPPIPKGLYFGATLAQNAAQRALPDDQRASGFTDADLPRLRDRLQREQANYHAATDKRLFAALVRRSLALPADQRIDAIDARFRGLDDAALEARIDTLYARTTLLDPAARERLMQQDGATLAGHDDPLLAFGIAWNADLQALRQRDREHDARVAMHRPAWRRAVAAHAGQPIAPDANGTLRVSFAHVQGYAPRDGVLYTPFTTMDGVLEKHTGEAPFDVPQAMRAAAAERGARWQQAELGDIPINFLADGDTSGGSSGSPVVNGWGELVGLNFDRVWENVAGDFGFNPAVSRNISVDIRYMLWLLDRVERADALLQELGVERAP
jgi:hypothetical protein